MTSNITSSMTSSKTNGTILLVEDNEDDAELMRRAFKRANFTNPVVVAADGAKALDMLFGEGGFASSNGVLPAMMILDLNLPKVSGLDVLRRVRGEPRTRHLPVVVMTTSVEDDDVSNSYARGANAYVRKPMEFEQFVESATRLGLFWLHTNVMPPR